MYSIHALESEVAVMQRKLCETEQELTEMVSAGRCQREENSWIHPELEQIKLQFELESTR